MARFVLTERDRSILETSSCTDSKHNLTQKFSEECRAEHGCSPQGCNASIQKGENLLGLALAER